MSVMFSTSKRLEVQFPSSLPQFAAHLRPGWLCPWKWLCAVPITIRNMCMCPSSSGEVMMVDVPGPYSGMSASKMRGYYGALVHLGGFGVESM